MTLVARLARTVAVTVLLGVSPLLGSSSPALAAGNPDNTSPAATRVLELTNAERQKAGLAPLTWSPQLTQVAQRYSEVLATDACFAHTCGPVPDLIQRAAQAGYVGWTTVGENIGAGYRSPEAVVDGWMASPGHRHNILSPEYREIGVGLAVGGRHGTYWTQDFGARRDPATVASPPPEADDAPGDE